MFLAYCWHKASFHLLAPLARFFEKVPFSLSFTMIVQIKNLPLSLLAPPSSIHLRKNEFAYVPDTKPFSLLSSTFFIRIFFAFACKHTHTHTQIYQYEEEFRQDRTERRARDTEERGNHEHLIMQSEA